MALGNRLVGLRFLLACDSQLGKRERGSSTDLASDQVCLSQRLIRT